MTNKLPAKYIKLLCNTVTEYETWPYHNDTTDVWSYAPYKWQVSFNVTWQTHSSPYTTIQFAYSGDDIKIGMWVAGGEPAIALKIVEIIPNANGLFQCILEDVERFNIFSDSTQNGIGIFPTGATCYAFEIGDDNFPIMFPSEYGIAISSFFASDITSRFRINNPLFRYRMYQTAHGFSVGDQVSLSPSSGNAVLMSASLYPFGQVVDISDSPDTFLVKPVNKIIEGIDPPLPAGNAGTIIYFGDSGALTTDPNITGQPAYIKINSTTGMSIEHGIENNGVKIYDNLTLRPTVALVGTMCMVLHDVDNEWALYLYNGSTWQKLSDYDSASSDSKTISTVINTASSAQTLIGNISAGCRVVLITVEVTDAFDQLDTISIGIVGNQDLLMQASMSDLNDVGTYTVSSNYQFSDSIDSNIYAFYSNSGSTVGSVKVKISYQ